MERGSTQINGGTTSGIALTRESQSGALVIEIMDMANLKNDRLMLMQTGWPDLYLLACSFGISCRLFTNAVRKPD